MAELHFPTLSFLLGAIIWAALYLLNLRLQSLRAQENIINQHGCKSPAKLPLKDPFFGIDAIYHTLRALKTKTFRSHIKGHYERYGNTFSSTLLTRPVISTIEPENITTILSTAFKDYLVGALRRDALLPLFGNSIILADGAQWQHSRALLLPTFARTPVFNLSALENHVLYLITAIPRDGSTVDLSDLFLRYTADVTTDFMFGDSLLSLRYPGSFQTDLMEAFRDAQTGGERRFRLGSLAKFVPQTKFHQAVKRVHKYIDAHIDKAIRQYDLRNHSPSDPVERYSLLHDLLKVTRDEQTLRDELTAILFAGRDTTSALLSNLFFVLAREPHIWQRLREHVNQLQGGKPTFDELSNMTYLAYCLMETLRLYPVVSGCSRIAHRDTVLPEGGGSNRKAPVFVAAGTLVLIHYFALHRRKDLWGSDADEFRPERWQTEKASWKFLPFGGGSRKCIGQHLALIEASYATVRLVQAFSAVHSRDTKPWTESYGAAYTSANGVKVAMTPC